jgi:hypothetical protein
VVFGGAATLLELTRGREARRRTAQRNLETSNFLDSSSFSFDSGSFNDDDGRSGHLNSSQHKDDSHHSIDTGTIAPLQLRRPRSNQSKWSCLPNRSPSWSQSQPLLHRVRQLTVSCSAPLHHVAAAHSQRFPSPYSTHVLSSDVISRTLSPTSSTITTTRLILKRGKMPRWAPSAMSRVGTSWVLEDSEVDLEKGDEVRVRSRNIDHKTVMEVCEWQTFKRDQEPGTGQER